MFISVIMKPKQTKNPHPTELTILKCLMFFNKNEIKTVPEAKYPIISTSSIFF